MLMTIFNISRLLHYREVSQSKNVQDFCNKYETLLNDILTEKSLHN
jgi:hypothetical protein